MTVEAASSADIAKLTGLQFLQGMIDGEFARPAIGRTLGFTLVSVSPGEAVFEMTVGPHLLNPLGSVHGGVALTLIDSAAGCAVHTELPAGTGYTTIETKVNFVRPISADSGVLRATGRVLNLGRQIASAEAQIFSDQNKLLAHGTSTLFIMAGR
jgi:uncharacterized protein (TIGR00369 family)